MIIVLFSIAFIVLTIALIVMSAKHLSDEIERLKDLFEYHKKIHKYERLMAGQKIKEFIQLLDKLKESTNKEENENQD